MRTFLVRTAPAAVVLAAALVVSGTTGAVAGKMITSAQIKNGTVASIDVKNDSLTGADVHNGSLGIQDTSTDLDAYEQRVGSFTTVTDTDPSVPNGQNGAVQLACPDGTAVLGAFSWWTTSSQGTQIEYVGLQQAQAFSPNTSGQADTLHLTLTCGAVVSS